MRRLEVVFRAEAEFDLLQIYRWVYEPSRNPSDDLEFGLRAISFERSAVIAYRVDNDQVQIVNGFYGGRNEALFQDRDQAGGTN